MSAIYDLHKNTALSQRGNSLYSVRHDQEYMHMALYLCIILLPAALQGFDANPTVQHYAEYASLLPS